MLRLHAMIPIGNIIFSYNNIRCRRSRTMITVNNYYPTLSSSPPSKIRFACSSIVFLKRSFWAKDLLRIIFNRVGNI